MGKSSLPRRKNVHAAAAAVAAYLPEEGEDDSCQALYDEDLSIWQVASQAVSFFTSCTRRFEVSSGQKAMGEAYMLFSLRRVGSLLYQMALCLRFKGICAHIEGSVPSGINHTNGVLTPAAGVQVEPYWTDYLGLAAMVNVEFLLGAHSWLEMTNDALLVMEEFMGTFNSGSQKMLGVHAASAVAPWDAAKFDRTVIIAQQFFFCRASGFALAMTAIGYHGGEVRFALASVDDLLVQTDVSVAAAGGTGSGSLSDLAKVKLHDQSKAWGQGVGAEVSNANILDDVYLLVNIITLPADEADAIMAQTITQNITTFETVTQTVHMATQPTEDYQASVKMSQKAFIDAIYLSARQKGASFSDLHCGTHAHAPSKKLEIITDVEVELDGNLIYQSSSAENAFEIYNNAPHASFNEMPLFMVSWSQDVSLNIATGSLPTVTATELLVKPTLNKAAFANGVQDVELKLVVQMKSCFTFAFGMVSV